MKPGLRRFALTAHVAFSVGWLGSVFAFLALSVAGLTSQDAQTVRSAYLAANLVTWWVVVPLSLASLLTGFVQSLGTAWGLFRHYWVVAKLLLTVPATVVLLVHTRPIGRLARVVEQTTLSDGDLTWPRTQLVIAPIAALVVLLVTTALAMYKPGGLTRYGQRRRHEQRG